MNHIPLKIEISLENNAVMLSDMPMDSILARLHFDKEKNAGVFNGNYGQNLNFLKFTNGVYHTSCPQYSIDFIENEFLTKSFDTQMFIEHGDKPHLKEVWNTQGGRFKNYLNIFEVKHVKKVTYYVCGDFEYICNLLSGLRCLGKKASLGYGKVKTINVYEIEDDLSLVKDGTIMRHLPLKGFEKYNNGELVMLPIVHPYWKRGNEDLCILAKGGHYAG